MEDKEEENIHMRSKYVPKVNVWGARSWNGKVSLKMSSESTDQRN